jgi:hypothetical protein
MAKMFKFQEIGPRDKDLITVSEALALKDVNPKRGYLLLGQIAETLNVAKPLVLSETKDGYWCSKEALDAVQEFLEEVEA